MHQPYYYDDVSQGVTSRHVNRILQVSFADFARVIGTQIDPNRRIASLWYGDIFVAHMGVKSQDRFDKGRPLSLIFIDVPGNTPLAGLNDLPIPPGFYVARAFLEEKEGLPGHVDLCDRTSQTVAQLIRDDGGSDGCNPTLSHTCENATTTTITYENCKICLSWDCDSFCHQSCITIPFCKADTGELVAIAVERQPCPFCKELILPDAVKCRYCQSTVAPDLPLDAYRGCGCNSEQTIYSGGTAPTHNMTRMGDMSQMYRSMGGFSAGRKGFFRGYSYCDSFGTMWCVDISPDGWPFYYKCGSCKMFA